MPVKPRNRTPWSRSALNAMELLYTAGWPLEAIAAHCGALDSTTRTRDAIWQRANRLGLKGRGRGGHQILDGYRDDLIDMMALDYSEDRMALELTQQHGRLFHQSWVNKELKRIGGNEYRAWRRREPERRARANQRRAQPMRGRKAA